MQFSLNKASVFVLLLTGQAVLASPVGAEDVASTIPRGLRTTMGARAGIPSIPPQPTATNIMDVGETMGAKAGIPSIPPQPTATNVMDVGATMTRRSPLRLEIGRPSKPRPRPKPHPRSIPHPWTRETHAAVPMARRSPLDGDGDGGDDGGDTRILGGNPPSTKRAADVSPVRRSSLASAADYNDCVPGTCPSGEFGFDIIGELSPNADWRYSVRSWGACGCQITPIADRNECQTFTICDGTHTVCLDSRQTRGHSVDPSGHKTCYETRTGYACDRRKWAIWPEDEVACT